MRTERAQRAIDALGPSVPVAALYNENDPKVAAWLRELRGFHGNGEERAMSETTKKVPMRLVGEDGNAFAIIGRFQREARRSGWTSDEIAAVVKEATAGDYDHLLATIIEHVDSTGSDEEDD